MDETKKERLINTEINTEMNTVMALELIKNRFISGQISEVVYKNICKEYEKVIEK